MEAPLNNFWDTALKVAAYLAPLGAVFVGIGLERFKARSIILERFLDFNVIGSKLTDPYYGNTSMMLNGVEYDNIVISNLELKNSSWISLKEFKLKIALTNGIFLGGKAWLYFQNSTIELVFTDEFREEIKRLLEINEEDYDDAFYKQRAYVKDQAEYLGALIFKHIFLRV